MKHTFDVHGEITGVTWGSKKNWVFQRMIHIYVETCTACTPGVNLKWCSWAYWSTKADTLTFSLTSSKLNMMQNIQQSTYITRVKKGLHCFNSIGASPHANVQASKQWAKYCCLGFPDASHYKDPTLVCCSYSWNSLGLMVDLPRTRITCRTSSKLHNTKYILTSEPFLSSNVIFWYRTSTNNTSLWIDNFWFCCCSGSDSSGGR